MENGDDEEEPGRQQNVEIGDEESEEESNDLLTL